MKFVGFFGFDDELLSVNVCFAFFKKRLSEVMTVDWINKQREKTKTSTFLLNFEHF